MKRLFLLVLIIAGAAGCKLVRESESSRNIRRANAPEQLAIAEQEIAAGELDSALLRLVAVWELTGLPSEVRAATERNLEQCAELILDQYSGEEYDSSDYKALYELELPQRLRALAGVLAAERMLEEGSRLSAFKMIKRLDKKIPAHRERARAADVVGRAGLSMIADGGRYMLFFKYRKKGIQSLEYLVLQYPLDPRCPEAYSALAEAYEDKRDTDRAINRHEELMFFHPQSPYTVLSEARLPYLRLLRLERADYDRRELVLAYDDVQRWLVRHPGHELEEWVRSVGLSCRTRLVLNDLILARYYQRVHEPFGTRIHAERALETAESAGLVEEAAEARDMLARLSETHPETEAVMEGSRE